MNYYAKAVPKLPLRLSTGAGVRFENIDHEVGIFATEDAGLIREIDGCIARNEGGVEKITSEQYLGYKSKKNGSLKPRWREEYFLRPSVRDRALRQSRQVADLAATDKIQEPSIQAPEVDMSNFRPTASK